MVHPVFPVEILDEIVRLSPKKVQLVLCRTSHLFHSLTTRSLYANISVDTASALVQLCSTLQSNLIAAACIKCLSISYPSANPPNSIYMASFYRILNNAFWNLRNLKNFRLLVADPYLSGVLLSAPTAPPLFPSLTHFETYLPLTSSLVTFLGRHPDLTYLEVSHYEDFSHGTAVTTTSGCPRFLSPVLPLLNLRHFVGNNTYLTFLTPTYPLPLRSAYLIWDATQEFHGPIESLAHASSRSLNVLTCRRRGWNLELISHIAIYLQDIYALHIINVLVVDSQLSQAFIDEVTDHLTRFRRLQHLKIRCEVQWGPNNIQCDLDREFNIVTDWGIACPSLLVITLPHSETVEWHKISDNIWVPVDISHGENTRSWLKNSMRSCKLWPLNNFKQLENCLAQSLPTNP